MLEAAAEDSPQVPRKEAVEDSLEPAPEPQRPRFDERRARPRGNGAIRSRLASGLGLDQGCGLGGFDGTKRQVLCYDTCISTIRETTPIT